jgi:hypothetical protein
VLISLFSIKTGVFESSWAIPWADRVELLPEDPGEAFLRILQDINSST